MTRAALTAWTLLVFCIGALLGIGAAVSSHHCPERPVTPEDFRVR
jgi:hypothetical protein